MLPAAAASSVTTAILVHLRMVGAITYSHSTCPASIVAAPVCRPFHIAFSTSAKFSPSALSCNVICSVLVSARLISSATTAFTQKEPSAPFVPVDIACELLDVF